MRRLPRGQSTSFSDNDFHNSGIGIIRHHIVPLARRAEKLINSKDKHAIDHAAIQMDLSVLGRFLVTKRERDLASFKKRDGTFLPGIAPVALQQGTHAGHNIARDVQHRAREPFGYFDRGTMATIGRAAAVADIRGLHLSGFLAWLAWLVVHIFFLIGFENRMLVLVQWAWSYLSYERGARLITGPWHAGELPQAPDGR